MARKSDIQYIRFYTDGSAARKIEPAPVKKKRPRPAPRPQKKERPVLHIYPIPAIGILLAAVMLVMIVAGTVRMLDARAELNAMNHYVAQMQQENIDLNDEYKAGYDLDAIREMALALGMIPKDQVQQETITLTIPQEVEEPSFWEQVLEFFQGLFA